MSELQNLKFKLNGSGSVNFSREDFQLVFNETDNVPEIAKEEYGYDKKLNEFRNKIDCIDNEIWKKIRWYINDYDFVVKYPIINRAFYKYWEMINEFDIFRKYNKNEDIILHCAEAPGGFIQGTNIFLQITNDSFYENYATQTLVDDDGFTIYTKKKKQNKKKLTNGDYKIYTISLNKDIPRYKMFNLPSYNKMVLNKYVHVLYGKDYSGDINNLENIDYIKDITSNKQFYLISGDGGFDEGCDFNNKEQLHYHLILNEIYTAIKLQKENGHFILKMFDIFTDTSIHLLYLLSICYGSVYIYKPFTSRPTNSEKYIICKNFKLSNENKVLFTDTIQKLSNIFNEKSNIQNKKCYSFLFFKEIPKTFIENIKNINTQLLQRQCAFLKEAIELCSNTDFIKNYEKEYSNSSENRRIVFKKWVDRYNLQSYI